MLDELLDFFNQVDLDELSSSLDELENEIDKLDRKRAILTKKIVEELEMQSAEFFVWLCFLRANFLRGKNVQSNKAYMQFIDYAKPKNKFYFEGFSDGPLVPSPFSPKFLYANQVEGVLKQVKEKYGSGRKFVEDIKGLVLKHAQDPLLLYTHLLSRLMSFDGVSSKIANAVIGEIPYRLGFLKKHDQKTFRALLAKKWLKHLALAGLFNVQVDSNVEGFFKEKIGIKKVEHVHFVMLASKVRKEFIKRLLGRYTWVEVDDRDMNQILKVYKDYLGANVIEKLIWSAMSMRRETKRKAKFFELSGDLFL